MERLAAGGEVQAGPQEGVSSPPERPTPPHTSNSSPALLFFYGLLLIIYRTRQGIYADYSRLLGVFFFFVFLKLPEPFSVLSNFSCNSSYTI